MITFEEFIKQVENEVKNLNDWDEEANLNSTQVRALAKVMYEELEKIDESLSNLYSQIINHNH